MHSIDELALGIKNAEALLAEPLLEPNPDRRDWAELETRVRLLRDGVENDVLADLDALLADVKEEEVKRAVHRRVASILGAVAAVVHASTSALNPPGSPYRRAGSGLRFADLLKRAAEITEDADERAEFKAGRDEPDTFCRLWHGRSLARKSRRDEADKIWKRLLRNTKNAALKKAITADYHAPRPIKSAPALFRLNGCGASIYGERDRQSDGWYVATYCICILFIPVFPLTAYIVRRQGSGYQFAAQARLSPFARACQAALLGAAMLGLGGVGINAWLESPSRKIHIAVEEARALESKGDRRGALERYSEVVQKYPSSPELGDAALAVMRLAAAAVEEPATPASVEAIGRVAATFDGLPSNYRAGAPLDFLAKRFVAWSSQIGDGDLERTRAALSVLDLAAPIVRATPQQAAIEAEQNRMRRSLADRLVKDRPLAALGHYVKLSDRESQEKALAILDGFGDGPSLWIDAEANVNTWLRENATSKDAHRISDKLAAARKTYQDDKPLIERGDEKELEKALKANPGDQEIAAVLATKKRSKGDAKGAVAMLDALGPIGKLTAGAQELLAGCEADQGNVARADEILTGFLDERLPAFQQAQHAYWDAAKVLQEQLIARAKAGQLDSALESRLKSAPEAEQAGIFRTWLSEQMEKDGKLASLKATFLKHEAVVPASLGLGMIKLRRANEAHGADRKKLVAEAERVFISIRQEAEGDPRFHLGLGQVYQRLGRTDDAEKEFKELLDRNEPELTLAVARTYRDLGLLPRARKAAETVFSSGKADKNLKTSAALLLANMALDLQEQESWLAKSDSTLPEVRDQLLEVHGRRLLQEGKLDEADQAFAKVIAACESHVEHDATAANNTAIAYFERYEASGDAGHIRSGLKHLEAAVRLAPDNAIVVGNLASELEQLGLVTVLDKWVQNRTLVLDGMGARELIDTLAGGPFRDQVVEAMRQDPSLRRSLELTLQEQALAPQSTASYERKVRWLEWMRDDAGLSEMVKQLEALPPFDGESVREERQKWESGSRDDEMKKELASVLTRAEGRVRRAERSAHKPTLAAALLLQARAIGGETFWDHEPDKLARSVAPMKRAAELWPEANVGDAVVSPLFEVGFFRALASSKVLEHTFAEEGRIYGRPMMLLHAMREGGAEVTSALRAQPELAEAARLRRAVMGARPTVFDWVLGRISGDEELEKAAKAAFARTDLKLGAKIDLLLHPGLPREKADLDLLEKGP